MILSEIKAEKILSKTQISLADYVINNYAGCQYSCLYCYARYSKRNLKHKREWGSFVDVKINAPELLEKELEKIQPKKVLLGSITEVYQPVEKKYSITRKLLEILAAHKIEIVILTRSDMILRDLDILEKFPKVSIFFTISDRGGAISNLFENGSPSFEKRLFAVKKLIEKNINVWAHIGPVIPFFTDTVSIIEDLIKTGVKKIELENLNKNSAPLEKIIEKLKNIDEEKTGRLKNLYSNAETHNKYWKDEEKKILNLLQRNNIKSYFSFSELNEYFKS